MSIDFEKRPLSWSAISSFEWSPEQWYERYVENKKEPPTNEMQFGKDVGERLASDPAYLPHVPRYEQFEYKLEARFGDIPLIGYIDGFSPFEKAGEYKTGRKAWDQKRVDTHGQLDMYALLLFLQDKVKPEDIDWALHWLPTAQNGDFSVVFTQELPVECHSFTTMRSMGDILRFGRRITSTVALMRQYEAARAKKLSPAR